MPGRPILPTVLVALVVWSQVVVAAFSVCGCCRAVAGEPTAAAAGTACCGDHAPPVERPAGCLACATDAPASSLVASTSPPSMPDGPGGCCFLADFAGQFLPSDGIAVDLGRVGLAVLVTTAAALSTVVAISMTRRTGDWTRLRRHALLSVWRN